MSAESQEIERLQREIQLLQEERNALLEIKRLKVQRLVQKLKTAPHRVAYNHPVVATLGEVAAKGAINVGKTGAGWLKKYVDYLDRKDMEYAKAMKKKKEQEVYG